MVQVQNLTYQFSGGTRLNFPNWQVNRGDHALILGPSGGGKTTFLHLLSGLTAVQSGSIVINDVNLGSLSGSQLDRFRGKHIGFVFQTPHLIDALTVEENVELANFFGRKPEKKAAIQSVLKDLGIDQLAKRKIHEISQGQAQRVAIARAVINQPDFIIGDEPTASLDDDSCKAVISLLKKQAEDCGATLIIATHDSRVKSEFPNQLML
ncbi:MAG: ABC transporter ATP-binding protein [Marinoscillum sp.]